MYQDSMYLYPTPGPQKIKAYIAGPMRGYDQYNFPMFDMAKDRLISLGWEIISPADLDRELGITGFTTDLPDNFIYDALRRDFIALCSCTAIVFIPGWEKSSGALAERFVAEHIGLDMYYLDPVSGEFLEPILKAATEIVPK